MEEREKLKNQILKMIKSEIDSRRAVAEFIVDKIDVVALIDVYNRIIKF